MKQRYRRRKEANFVDPDFAESLHGSESEGFSSDRQAKRKAQQFCRQVQRALNLALAGCGTEEGLSGLFVEEVFPAPDCGRLLVHVAVTGDQPVADVLLALRRAGPQLRSEVAAAISRKRAPELSFVPSVGEVENHE